MGHKRTHLIIPIIVEVAVAVIIGFAVVIAVAAVAVIVVVGGWSRESLEVTIYRIFYLSFNLTPIRSKEPIEIAI